MTASRSLAPLLCAAALLAGAATAPAALSIYDIQYTPAADGASPQDGNLIDCAGGVVTYKWYGGKARIYLRDPARADWAAIMVKDWTADVYNGVAPGDRVSLTNVTVEESRGNTILKYHTDYGSGFTVVSSGHAVPAPLVVTPSAMPAPVEGPPGEWYVADHSPEKYEHMWLTIEDVTVAAMDLGHAVDNYSLRGAAGDDCWAADYMNADVGADGYHRYVSSGAAFDSVTGIFEQYTHLTDRWDHYQLVTTKTADLVPEPGFITILLTGATAVLARRRSR